MEISKENIQSMMDRLGYTKAELAQYLGVSYVTVCRWVEGENKPQGPVRRTLKRLIAKGVK